MQLALIPAFPIIASFLLAIFGPKFSRKVVSFLGVFGIASSFIATLFVLLFLFSGGKDFQAYREILWTWIPFYSSEMDTATIQMAFYLDALSAVMLMVVTFISSLIALFSVTFMEDDAEISWFFACMNLFVGMMLILVLADNFLVLFLGWEGVGLTSYLLIGFWRNDVLNGRAATKAFITTRIGDIFLLFGIFLVFSNFGTLNIQEVLDLADANWPVGSLIATITALCFLGGAIGKSAQLPLQTWLADAMRGPTPVSALIHAATMVTAGVYLIARVGTIFSLSPIAQSAVMWIGAATLIFAGIGALLQNDLKRVLAYSTMSQLGYMFLALGAGAYSAAIFHLATHACFKALLFLGAGVIGYLMHHEYSLTKIGNLRYQYPLIFWVFLIGLGSLTALPFITAGFYSKELILSEVFLSSAGGMLPWAIGAFGALLTGAYSARLFILLFYKPSPQGGEGATHSVAGEVSVFMKLPLTILAILALVAGFFPIAAFVSRSVLSPVLNTESHTWKLEIAVTVLALMGILLGTRGKLLKNAVGLDAFYEGLFTKPYIAISSFMRADPIRPVYRLFVLLAASLQHLLALLQNGRLTYYVTALILAVLLVLSFAVLS
ncbi:MAG: NADH-quinone oxidoreductase subunit L [Myxococcaceae bacterium]